MVQAAWPQALAKAFVPDFDALKELLDKAIAGILEMGDQVQLVKLSLESVRKEIDKAPGLVKSINERLCTTEQQQKDLFDAVSGLDRKVDHLNDDAAVRDRRVRVLGQQIQAVDGDLTSTKQELKDFRDSVQNCEKRCRWLYCYICLLPFQIPKCPHTPCSQLIQACGCKDLPSIAKQDPDEFCKRLEAENARLGIMSEPLEMQEVVELIRMAQGYTAKT